MQAPEAVLRRQSTRDPLVTVGPRSMCRGVCTGQQGLALPRTDGIRDFRAGYELRNAPSRSPRVRRSCSLPPDPPKSAAIKAAACPLPSHAISACCRSEATPRETRRPRESSATSSFHRVMQSHGIDVVETQVGDRYVLEVLTQGGYSLGREQSGRVIMSEHATTGDGILTGLHLMAEMARSGKSLGQLASVMTVYPQVLLNVRGVDRAELTHDPEVRMTVERVSRKLGADGRVLLRPSGTEPVVRVMVEAPHLEEAQLHAETIAGTLTRRLVAS